MVNNSTDDKNISAKLELGLSLAIKYTLRYFIGPEEMPIFVRGQRKRPPN